MIKIVRTRDGMRYLRKPTYSFIQCDLCCFYKKGRCKSPTISEIGICFDISKTNGTTWYYYEKIKLRENRLKII